MKVKMLLLVSTVVLLVSPGEPGPASHRPEDAHRTLNVIFELAEKYNKSLFKEYFVEDVSHLAEGGNKCEDKFFCKVYDVLHAHEHFKTVEERLVRNLKIYVDGIHPNCKELLKDMTPTGIFKPIPDLLDSLTCCVQNRNLNMTGDKP